MSLVLFWNCRHSRNGQTKWMGGWSWQKGCWLLCPMPGCHKPGAGNYYPVMLKPNGTLPPGSSHADININSITTLSPEEYNERLCYVLGSTSNHDYEHCHKETGICKPSIVSALPRFIPVPKCFPADTMHLFGLNLSQLLVSLWHGNIDHALHDDPKTWPFAILHDNVVWQTHGASVAGACLCLSGI